MSKTFLFQVIQFSINTLFASIWPKDRALSDVTTPGQSGLGSDGNKGVLRIPQSSSITGNSPSHSLVSYPGHSLRWGLTSLQRCSRCILHIHISSYTSLVLAGPSGIRVRWGIEINGRFAAERPPSLAGPHSGGWAATLTPLYPLYSTGPCCPG